MGQIAFIVYGLLIGAVPIIVANGILLIINCYQIIQLYRSKEIFDVIEVKEGDMLVAKFLKTHEADILSYFPDFKLKEGDSMAVMVFRDLTVANLFIADLQGNGEVVVRINYTIPKYRDFKIGKFLFEKEKDYFMSKGIRKIIYPELKHQGHIRFIQSVGFKKVQESNMFYKVLD